MRRTVVIASAAAIMAGVIASVALRRKSYEDVPGNLPGGGIGSGVNTWLNAPLYRLMAAALDPQPDDELLDVACGEGAFLAEHASRARRVAGLDLSAIKVGLAQRRLADRIAAGTAEVVNGDAGALPWEDGRFSAVTCMDAFALFPDPERVLAEMWRVLRPGGRAVMGIGWKVAEGTATHKMLGTFWVWNEAEVRRMTGEAGFDDVAISYARMAGDNRLGNLLCRLVMGTDEMRIVTAIKPVPVRPADDVRAEEAVAVG
jgi:SAM-dependent methyltransferase